MHINIVFPIIFYVLNDINIIFTQYNQHETKDITYRIHTNFKLLSNTKKL